MDHKSMTFKVNLKLVNEKQVPLATVNSVGLIFIYL